MASRGDQEIAGREAEILHRLADGRPYILRQGNKVMNPGHFARSARNFPQPDVALEREVVAARHLARIYTSPLDRQASLATQLAGESSEVAPSMWFEAVFSGHAVVQKAIEDAKDLVIQDGHRINNFEDAIGSYQRQRRAEVFAAPAAEKHTFAQAYLDEFVGDEDQLLFQTCVHDDETSLRYLLIDKAVKPYPEADGSNAPMHAASYHGNLGAAQVLRDLAGVDVNVRDDIGGTPLMRAAVGGRTEIVRWLLQHGADVAAVDDRNYTALDYGAGQDVEITKVLLEHGAKANPMALAAAASFGNEASFELLVKAGDYPTFDEPRPSQPPPSNEQKVEMLTALSMAGQGGSAKILEWLLVYVTGCSPPRHAEEPVASFSYPEPLDDLKDAIHQTTQGAISGDRLSLAETILAFTKHYLPDELGAQQVGHFLRFAAQVGATKCARYLITTYDVDVNAKLPPPYSTSTPLHLAVREGRVATVEMLVKEHGADVLAMEGPDGARPLFIAVSQHDEAMTRLLMELGASVNLVQAGLETGLPRIYVAATKEGVAIASGIDSRWDREGTPFLCLEFPADDDGVRTIFQPPSGRESGPVGWLRRLFGAT